ncbi:cysteine desulfurase [Cellulomonas fimi]|uniref:cysteine desulfurase family protein n=1 Tax=Cellulomonas fimi TaxID=1708 RepID=UPI00234C3D90|nr:cysteine desulfurase family protein [Cellulomonas fimi]MDC7120574.1 cysteine desulfurase [Cellulomonas fimi]
MRQVPRVEGEAEAEAEHVVQRRSAERGPGVGVLMRDLEPLSARPAALVGAPVYADYNATTPVDPAVLEAMLPFLSVGFGNPSSTHSFGRAARDALTGARSQIAALLDADDPSTIVLTGSGSEADALAIRGAVLASPRLHTGAHVITQATEHPAVLAAVDYLRELHDVRVTVIPVDETGRVEPEAVASAITEQTVLVSVMHANNETGTVQPIAQIAEIAHRHGALMHTDAAQSVGKLPVSVKELGVDLLTVVGHKMYAPKGVGALYVAPGTPLRPVVDGGGQEAGRRAGTENVAYAVGLGVAADLAAQALAAGESERLRRLRDRLHQLLEASLPGRVHLNGHPEHRLPNTLNVSITDARALTVLNDLHDVAASAGSACHAGTDRPSDVLTAMGMSRERALSALRLSLGRWTSPADVACVADRIAAEARPVERLPR